MKSIKFPGANIEIGKNQSHIYNVLHAMHVPNSQGELIMCFELSDEELEEINRTKKIYYSRLTFGSICAECNARQGFMPMRLSTSLADGIELKSE